MASVDDIIAACGQGKLRGAPRIEQESEGALTRDAVYKWPKIGIPDRHWELIQRLSGCSIDELYEANKVARRPNIGSDAEPIEAAE